jgi:ABC-2 type transport system permease protein
MLAVGAVLLSFGASAIGLFYSISNARYNPDNPQHRISPGASLIMYLINLLFLLLLGFTLLYLIPPAELLAVLPLLPEVPPPSNAFLAALLKIVIFITTPFKWSAPARIASGLLVTGAVWSAFFFGFMAATVRQSRKGFHVEIVKGLPGRKTKMPKK